MHIDAVRYRTNFNTLIEASDAGYLSTRADLIAGKSFVWGDNRFWDAYGRFALIHDIDGKSKVRVADYGFAEDLSPCAMSLAPASAPPGAKTEPPIWKPPPSWAAALNFPGKLTSGFSTGFRKTKARCFRAFVRK